MPSASRKRSNKKSPQAQPLATPAESAKAAGLRYVYDNRPGITRRRHGKSFRYFDADSKPIRDKETLARIKSLVIPPAWNEVWICPLPNGHLQATGRDARKRKQSRYHPRWREVRDEAKYEHMILFGRALPAIRERVDHDLALSGLPREKVFATIIRLMETTHIRIGNEEYARTNQSYGLTTLRRRHVTIRGSRVIFNFKGKSGVEHTIDVSDRRLARIVQACHDTPGYELFEYLDHDGNAHTIGSSDVNEYLDSLTPPDSHFTAKDFRTWAGTVLACVALREFEAFDSATQAKKNVVAAIKSVSERLGNTPSVCRKCYVHPAVLERYISGTFTEAIHGLPKYTTSKHGPSAEESTLLHMLATQLEVAA
jgi:DNA topoisomerase-1